MCVAKRCHKSFSQVRLDEPLLMQYIIGEVAEENTFSQSYFAANINFFLHPLKANINLLCFAVTETGR